MTRFCGHIRGSMTALPSKSLLQRYILLAALSNGESRIYGARSLSGDILSALGCAEALGAKAAVQGSVIIIEGNTQKKRRVTLNCGESATVYRLLYPAAPLLAGEAEFLLSPALSARPMQPIKQLLSEHGVKTDGDCISGVYSSGDFQIRGDVSSQYISGLIIALSLLADKSRIILTTPPQSRGYIELTRAAVSRFGGVCEWEDEHTLIVLPARFSAQSVALEGDYSYASLPLAAGAVYGSVTVSSLSPASLQPDRAIIDLLRRFGADVSVSGDCVFAGRAELTGTDIDISQTPDLAPAAALLGLAASGRTRLYNGCRLRLKESDRIASIVTELSRLGADISEQSGGFTINGGAPLHPARCSAHGDHRIAMLLMMASGLSGGLEIEDAECIAKSAPGFVEEFIRMGGRME